MARSSYHICKNNTVMNLYSTKAEALANEGGNNTECLAVYFNGTVSYAATNDNAAWPNSYVMAFKINNKTRYVHTATWVTKSKTAYANPNDVAQYASAQAAYDANPSLFSDAPGTYQSYDWTGAYVQIGYHCRKVTGYVFIGYHCMRVSDYVQIGYHCRRVSDYTQIGYYCRRVTGYPLVGYARVTKYAVVDIKDGSTLAEYSTQADAQARADKENLALMYIGMPALYSVADQSYDDYNQPIYDYNNPNYDYQYIRGPANTSDPAYAGWETLDAWKDTSQPIYEYKDIRGPANRDAAEYSGWETLDAWKDTSQPIYEYKDIRGPNNPSDPAYEGWTPYDDWYDTNQPIYGYNDIRGPANRDAAEYTGWETRDAWYDTGQPIYEWRTHDKSAYTVTYGEWY